MPKNGRPPTYKTREELQAAVDAYFDSCDNKIIKRQHATGKGVTIIETPTPYTMAGLALALNVSRETLNEYSKMDQEGNGRGNKSRREFSDIITRARQRVEAQKIEHGLVGCYDSKLAVLDLASNHGYSTKQDVAVSGTLSVETVNYDDTEK